MFRRRFNLIVQGFVILLDMMIYMLPCSCRMTKIMTWD